MQTTLLWPLFLLLSTVDRCFIRISFSWCQISLNLVIFVVREFITNPFKMFGGRILHKKNVQNIRVFSYALFFSLFIQHKYLDWPHCLSKQSSHSFFFCFRFSRIFFWVWYISGNSSLAIYRLQVKHNNKNLECVRRYYIITYSLVRNFHQKNWSKLMVTLCTINYFLTFEPGNQCLPVRCRVFSAHL